MVRVLRINRADNAYIFTKSGVKTFAKNLAIETTYKIKFTETWKGRKLRTLLTQLHEMFKNVLDKTRGDDQDLGLVGITHPQLNNTIVVPIQKWSLLNSNTVMDNIERVINSEENLPLDAQMQITIGSIAIPRGSGTLAITRLTGPQNSIAIKRSLMKISNDNHMYLATAKVDVSCNSVKLYRYWSGRR